MNASFWEIMFLLAGGAGFVLLATGCSLMAAFLFFTRRPRAPHRGPEAAPGSLFPWD